MDNIKAAIFDVDGTLLESMHIWRNLGDIYLETKGLKSHENLTEAFRSMSMVQSAEHLKKNYRITDSVEKIIADMSRLIENFYFNEAEIKPGVTRLLEALRIKGVKMCVATASNRYIIEAGLQRCGILQYFDEIFTCNEVGCGKDKPDIFYRALNFLGTEKSDTYVFEDALYAIKTAKSEGFPIIAVYDKFSENHQDEIKNLADFYFESFDQWK